MRVRATIVSIIILLCPASALALVNINTATLDELDTLPGVGPATAQKIIDARPFSSVGDIEQVAGIGGPGTKTYDDIIGLITISGDTTVTTEEEDKSEDDDISAVSSSQTKDSGKKVVYPVTGLKITAPAIAHVNELVEFIAEPSDGRKGRLVRYHWNFGDGTTSDTASPVHSYKYPGTYVVIVESYYLKEERVSRHEIEVLPVTISISSDVSGAVTITNNGKEEINLHGMTVGGRGEFIFPKHSILMPGKSITVTPTDSSKSDNHLAVLRDSAGAIVASEKSTFTMKPTSHSFAAASTKSVSTNPVTKQGPEDEMEVSEETASFGVSEAHAAGDQVASASRAETKDFWPYAGLLAVILFGLYSIYTNRSSPDSL